MIVDLNEVMQTKKQYSDSTLNNMKKADLIKYVRQCEWNRDVAISFNQQQYRNYLQMANQPVKTNAEWIFNAEYAKWGNPYVCSNCNEEFSDTYNYCPNCGCKMKAEREE